MRGAHDVSRLRFLNAARLAGPCGALAGMALESGTGEALGRLAGVLIDPPARRVCYLVVERVGLLRRRQYLISSDCPTRFEPGALLVDLDAADAAGLEEFDTRSVPRFSAEDTVDAMFGRVA